MPFHISVLHLLVATAILIRSADTITDMNIYTFWLPQCHWWTWQSVSAAPWRSPLPQYPLRSCHRPEIFPCHLWLDYSKGSKDEIELRTVNLVGNRPPPEQLFETLPTPMCLYLYLYCVWMICVFLCGAVFVCGVHYIHGASYLSYLKSNFSSWSHFHWLIFNIHTLNTKSASS